MVALELRNVTKKYSSFSLSNISYTLPFGKIMGLVGKNGAGKTTMLKIINNSIESYDGEIIILGRSNKDVNIKQNIGVVIDTMPFPSFWTASSVEKNIGQFFLNWKPDTYHISLVSFGLDKKQKISQMSQGMKVKLMIAFACAYDAKLLILDEPTNGLDPISRNELLVYFKNYVADGKHSILFSTHITSDLDKIADIVSFLIDGTLRFTVTKEDLSNSSIIKIPFSAPLAEEIVKNAKCFTSMTDHFFALLPNDDIPRHDSFEKSVAVYDDIMIILDRELQL
jgi:ABC-2 type transport system ATP-binding protein